MNTLRGSSRPEISMAEALELTQTGEWRFGSEVMQAVFAARNDFKHVIVDDSRPVDFEQAGKIISSLQEATLDLTESRTIRYVPPPPHRIELRIQEGFVVKASDALRELVIKSLGFALAVATAGQLSTPILLSLLRLSVYDLIRSLSHCWERLEDPYERRVFEAVFALSAKMSVNNYDALAHADFERAYQAISPSTADVMEYVHGSMNAIDVERVLAELKRRELLQRRDDRWWIPF